MNHKLLFGILIVGLLVVGSVINLYLFDDETEEEENLYQGAVPLGYDLEHFRKTGETILEVDD